MHGGIVAMSAVLKLRGFVWRATLMHLAQRFAGQKAHLHIPAVFHCVPKLKTLQLSRTAVKTPAAIPTNTR